MRHGLLSAFFQPATATLDYNVALKEISQLRESDPELGTSDGDHPDVLTTRVQAYKAKYYPIDLAGSHGGYQVTGGAGYSFL